MWSAPSTGVPEPEGEEKDQFALYPVFPSPEEEYKYISWRMAELERQLGHDKLKVKSRAKPKKERAKKERVGKREKKAAGEARSGKKKGTKKSTTKKTNVRGEAKESEVSDTSREQDSISVGSRESEMDSSSVPEEVQRPDQEEKAKEKPRLRKAASFLFNKTSDVRAYLRRKSADIRDMASPGATKEEESAQASTAPDSQETKRSKRNQNRRSAQQARPTQPSGEDLNNIQHDEEVIDEMSYDPRYTDAVFIRPTSRHHSHHYNVSDYETFSIMIEEDSTTYDSPSMLPAAMPDIEVDIELDEDDDSSAKTSDVPRHSVAAYLPSSSSSSSPASSSSSSSSSSTSILVRVPSPAAAPVPSRWRNNASLGSKASYRLTMPPVPPSAAKPPHMAYRRQLQYSDSTSQPEHRRWGAPRPLPPTPPVVGKPGYSHSSGAIPTSARPRASACIC